MAGAWMAKLYTVAFICSICRGVRQQFSMRRARNGLVLWYAGARLTESDLQQVADLVVSSHRT
jgi:hypothetical protein